MIRTCQCPSCGAKVDFRASSTLLAVCEYCQSTLIRTDVDVENLGKMADLLPDSSLLQIGSQGRYKTTAFSVIGRVQYQHETGIWNEWYLLFDNGKTGWLSEASGSFVISFLSDARIRHFALEEYKLNLTVPLFEDTAFHKERLTVTNIEKARCIAGQGELPFRVNAGFDVTVIDLSNQNLFVSLDFSETPPLVFIGEPVELHTLFLSHLREINQTEIKTNTRSFNCPNCAAPIQTQLSSAQTITCSSCTAILDISHKNVDILVKSQKALHRLIQPVIPLGSVGKFEGVDFTVIGFSRCRTQSYGRSYYWGEFLLHHPIRGFRWLITSEGHWTIAQALQKWPEETYQSAYYKKNYKHFANYKASVIQVMGEFYWRVKFDDQVTIDDYISPPSILSKERIAKEITWTAGEYITTHEVELAFGNKFKLPEPVGITANQPSPYIANAGAWVKASLFFIFIAVVLQLYFVSTSENKVVLETYANFQKYTPYYPAEQALASDSTLFQSQAFTIQGRPSNLIIEQSTNLNNSWLATDVAMVEQTTGEVFHAEREASYYSGYDSDGAWAEDNSRQEIIFSKVPAGNYYLRVEADSDWSDSSRPPVNDYIKVSRAVPQWSNFWFLILFLLIGPGVFYYFHQRFEVKRWAESDHPMVTSDE